MSKHINNIPVTLQIIDTPKRDLDNKLVLASHLADYGIASIIGTHEYITHAHSKSNGSLWLGRLVSNDGRSAKDKALRSIMPAHNTRLFYLHDEGAFYLRGFYEHDIIRTYPTNLVDEPQTKQVFFWGERQKDIYASHTSPDTHPLLATVGAPRFDLCKRKYEKIDQERVSHLQSKYGEFILFCTRFPGFNPAPDVISPLGKRKLGYARYGLSTESQAVRHVFNMWHKVGDDFISFVKLIQEAAFFYPDQQFLVRPHPAENHYFYKEAFSSFPNIVIDHSGDLRPVIRAAKLVIHSECTSGFEAALSGTPSINFVPSQNLHPDLLVEGLNTLGPVVTDQDQALDTIGVALKGYSKEHTSLPASFNRIISNIEYDSIPLITEHINSFCLKNNWTTSFGFAPLKQHSARILQSSKNLGKLLLKRGRPLGKKLPLTHFEVEKLFEKIQEVDGTKANLISFAHDHIIISP